MFCRIVNITQRERNVTAVRVVSMATRPWEHPMTVVDVRVR